MFPDQLRTGRFPAAIGLSLVAARLAVRLANGALTYGFKRVEILSAQANGVTLLVLACFITYEANNRLFAPPHGRTAARPHGRSARR